MINFDVSFLDEFVTNEEIEKYQSKINEIHDSLHFSFEKNNDFKGWLELPNSPNFSEIKRIKLAAEKIRKNSDIFLIIGIGGSYLGARAAIEFLNSQNYNYLVEGSPQIFFVGNSINSKDIEDILKI